MDVSSAFLNGELEDKVYLKEPGGFETADNTHAWHLKKALYGLKQAGREWHKKLHKTLCGIGFTRVRCEHSVWVYCRESDKSRMIVPVFVDDITIAGMDVTAIEELVGQLRNHFKLRDLGETSYLLGVKIERNRSDRSLTLSQHQYILDILQRANMPDCKPLATPLDPGVALSSSMGPKDEKEKEEMKKIPYVNILGAVAYLAISTRPDIAYAVSVLSRFSKSPGPMHWNALKNLLRYLKGTKDYKLRYAPDPTSELLTTYSDADHGGNPDNKRSTSGYVVKMGTGAISWSSRLQPFVTLSTTEAEYVAAVAAAQEILWLRNLFTELGYKFDSPSVLYLDNQSALAVAKNPDHHGRVKHLDLRFYWLRDEVEKGTIHVRYISTEEMPADGLTKSLGRQKLLKTAESVGLVA